MIISRTPMRISLCGGGTDMSSFYEKHMGAVVSFAIDKFIYISVNRKFDDKIRVSYSKIENVESVDEIQHNIVRETLKFYNIHKGYEITSISDIPGEGSGLGSSSALAVGLVNALNRGVHPSTLAERAYCVESEKALSPVGKQDHFASAHGGMNYMTFRKNRVEVETLYPQSDMVENLLLLHTGVTRSANGILETQKGNFKNGNTIEFGKQLAALAYSFRNEWIEGKMSYERFGEFLHTGWEFKKLLSTVSTPQIDKWYELGLKNGAHGGKLLGAGGGGFLLFAAPFETHARIAEATGLRRIDFKVEMEGSKIIYES